MCKTFQDCCFERIARSELEAYSYDFRTSTTTILIITILDTGLTTSVTNYYYSCFHHRIMDCLGGSGRLSHWVDNMDSWGYSVCIRTKSL